MKSEVVVIAAVFVFFAVLEVFNTGLLNKKNEKSGDMLVEIVSALSLMLLIQPATLSTGAVVRVPLFVQEGEVIKVDTRTGEYVGRIKN